MSEAGFPSTLKLQQLVQSLQHLPDLTQDNEVEMVELAMGEVLFEQGDTADGFYMLIAGSLGVRVRHEDGQVGEIDRLEPGAIVGEMAMLSGQTRSATVYAINDAGLLRFSREAYEELVADAPEAQTAVNAHYNTRWQRIQLSRVLQHLLGDIDPLLLHTLQEELTWLHLSNGDVLFHKGDEPDGMYIVINGRLRVNVEGKNGAEQTTIEIPPGETVGEYPLLASAPRTATVYAVRETNVVRMTPQTFEKLGRINPDFVVQLTKIIVARRQRTLNQTPTPATSMLSIAILPISPTVDTDKFAQELSDALAQFGKTAVLNAAEFDSQFGQSGVAQTDVGATMHANVVAWLDEFEADKAYVLYTADPTPTAWTRHCVGHADRVLLLADPSGDPTPGAVEQMLAQIEVPMRTELVLWHPVETKRPSGTAVWLDARPTHTHHHIRQGDAAHMSRLARRLTNNAVGLVLSGGAARGFAHVGVHRAMEELGIPVDYIGATSMGAVVGASIALYGKNAELMNLGKQFGNTKALLDRTLPFTSLMASRRVTQAMQSIYGDAQIEDLWTPFFCVASNITMAEPAIMQRGPLWRAVRASLAIPAVFTPVMIDGDTLVDGGVMDNFPVRLTKEMSEGQHIIGVNVAPFKEKKRTYDFETYISGWRILLSRLNPFTKSLRAPSIIGIILRTLDINSVQRGRDEGAAYVDLMLNPESQGIGMLDFDKFDQIVANGYSDVVDTLRAWKESKSIFD